LRWRAVWTGQAGNALRLLRAGAHRDSVTLMSIWIRALCTRGLGALTVAELRRATGDSDFFMMAEGHGLEDEEGEAAEEALRFEGAPGELTEAKMYYRPDNPKGLFIAVSRWRGEQARGEADELLELMEDRSGAGAERIRDVLSRTVETVAFCLKQSDADGMGWPISWHTAMWLASKGEGLVEADGEWWDPETWERV
jgi:hypothetical protein